MHQVMVLQKCFECWLIVNFFQHCCHCHSQDFNCVFISTLALPWVVFIVFVIFGASVALAAS